MSRFTLEGLMDSQLPCYIGGAYVDSNGEGIPSFDPATGKPWCQITDCTADDVDRAVKAARSAMYDPAWRDISQSERGTLMYRLADIVQSNVERLARIETKDNGKILREMRALIGAIPVALRYFAGMADKIEGTTIPVNKPDMLNFTLREPIGVVAIVTPWNSPLYMLVRSLAPCLAIGNTVVVKPSEHASAGTIAFAELMNEAGFPDGVLNVVTGYGDTAGEALISHPGLDKIDFTGGTLTGRKIAASAAQNLTPSSLELGGKSPHVVFDDADPDRAANGVVSGIFAAAGQTCVAGSRCYIHESIHDEVVDRIVARAGDIRIGAPDDEATQLGPLALWSQVEKVGYFVDTAKKQGAKLAHGGGRPKNLGDGWYVDPTVFVNVTNQMLVARDEIFGPVLGIVKFSTEAELIELANDTNYGLAAGIWTRDIDRALRFVRRIDAGMVWVNTYRAPSIMSPFGGFKDSGNSKHNGHAAIHEFSRLKTVVVDYSGATHDAFVMRVVK
ncbi:MAG: aldehyde dehydrogenase [Rhizobiales bacterium]|nr:aldehyde dehydrogenase [Hyphomicrobiales bacterium]